MFPRSRLAGLAQFDDPHRAGSFDEQHDPRARDIRRGDRRGQLLPAGLVSVAGLASSRTRAPVDFASAARRDLRPLRPPGRSNPGCRPACVGGFQQRAVRAPDDKVVERYQYGGREQPDRCADRLKQSRGQPSGSSRNSMSRNPATSRAINATTALMPKTATGKPCARGDPPAFPDARPATRSAHPAPARSPRPTAGCGCCCRPAGESARQAMR